MDDASYANLGVAVLLSAIIIRDLNRELAHRRVFIILHSHFLDRESIASTSMRRGIRGELY